MSARLAIVANDVSRLPPSSALPRGTTTHPREELDALQRLCREQDGVSVIIYDQVCATEKRRRRKRGTMAQAARSVIINPDVCENCGDCSAQSGCIAIEPIDTPLGRKRRINPSSCNTDLSCLKGFCPSFVTMDGPPRPPQAHAHWEEREAALFAALREPVLPHDLPWRALFAGIGGGGVVTTGAIAAMAGHLDGLEVRTLDFTGLAQKNGAVVAHIQIGGPGQLDVARIPLGAADLMLAADLAVGASPGVLDHCRSSAAIIGNLDLAATAALNSTCKDRQRLASPRNRARDRPGAIRLSARGRRRGKAVRRRAGNEHDVAWSCLATRSRADEPRVVATRDRDQRRGRSDE